MCEFHPSLELAKGGRFLRKKSLGRGQFGGGCCELVVEDVVVELVSLLLSLVVCCIGAAE